jgi:LysR family glycine cleavage system transcriptional activator
MRGLHTFCTAARHRTLRQAADELFITPSAVSHQLKKLEAELGLALFQREGRTLALTEAGEMLFESIQEPLIRVETAAAQVRARYARASLRVSVQPFFASELLMPALSEFQALHPEIDLVLDASDESKRNLPANVDVAIRLFETPPADRDSRRLFPLTLVPACSPELRDRLRDQPQQDTAPFPVVVHRGRPDAWKQWAAQSGVLLPMTGNVVRLDAMSAIVQAAERGLGVALVPLQLTETAFREGRLVRLFDHALDTTDAYHIVCREKPGERQDVLHFRDWALERFRAPKRESGEPGRPET